MKKRRFISLLLVLAVTVCQFALFSETAYAAVVDSGTCGYNTWQLDSSGCLTISGTEYMDGYNFDYYRSEEVGAAVPPWFRYRNSIETIKINQGIKGIGEEAFQGLIKVNSVSIPSSVKYIGNCAFEGCESLKTIVIPAGIPCINAYTFAFCENLTSITLPEGIEYLDNSSFEQCIALTNVTIPSSVKKIWDRAFSGCESLSSIIIPSKVSTIGWYSFEGCCNLTSITISKSVTKIDEGAFIGCDKLKTVYYEGTKADWEKIIIDDINNSNIVLKKATVQCSDSRVPGDVNNDGKVTTMDATLIKRYIVGGYSIPVFNKENADVNGDGKVTTMDATLIKRYIVGGYGVVLK